MPDAGAGGAGAAGPDAAAPSAPAPDSRPVAVVTGARKGIGRHLAESLLGAGYRVLGCGRGAEGWEADGFAYHVVDVADEAQVLPFMRHVTQAYGRLDALINCAALASMNHTILTPVSSVEKMLRVNVTGTFLMSRESAKLMRKRRFGRIVNVSSAVVPLRLSGEAAYLASKSAVQTLSQVMARELSEFGITVNVVAPGPTDTDMIRGVPKAKIDELTQQFFNKRLTTLDDIANVVHFFLRPGSGGVTGQVIYLNGVPNG
ncbi:MAG: SDR family oxidoreductase [Gemmatimonadetes bacterium]|nr:SDR family oxidoreductase [Gemmatimonadota bacterium]